MSKLAPIPMERPSRSYKIVVRFERRPDGGVRAWSDQVPGFVLSHSDAEAVLADIQPALEGLISAQFGVPFIAIPLADIRTGLEGASTVEPSSGELPRQREYAALGV